MKKILFFGFTMLFLVGKAQNKWEKFFGGSQKDEAYDMIQDQTGNFVMAGNNSSKGNNNEFDVWVLKTDDKGNKQWDKTFGGSGLDTAYSISEAKDGGYALGGCTSSKGSGYYDFWVIKLDRNGNKQWDKTFGGSGRDECRCIITTSDGGYAMAGTTESKGNGQSDFWMIKLDRNGNKQWDKTFGGSGRDECRCIITTSDGGYAMAGTTESKGNGQSDFWLVKLDMNGHKQWDKTFGGKKFEECVSVIQDSYDNGYVLGGHTMSQGLGGFDLLILKTNNIGNKKWEKTFGSKRFDIAYDIVELDNHSYVIAGYTETKGNADLFIIKLKNNGYKQWEKKFGGKGSDAVHSIIQTKNGGIGLAGHTNKEMHNYDMIVINLDNEGNLK